MFKRVVFVLSLLLVGVGLASCGKGGIQIGILQYDTAGALDAAREGFIEALKEGGYVNGNNISITVLNPRGNANDNTSMAKNLVRKSDLLLGIATPSAVALKVEADEQGLDTPILFTAVTDPVAVHLIDSPEKPGGNVTGTNDMNPIAEQIALARELLPMATKLGIIYSSNEENSRIQAEEATTVAESLGFSVIEGKITSINDLNSVASNLLEKVDVLYVPTDNTVVSGIGIVNGIATDKKVPIIIGEENSVDEIPGLTYSIDYYRLGKETGKMAVQILDKEKEPKDIPSTGLSEFKLVVNKKRLEEIGVTVKTSILDRADEVYE